MIFKVKQWTAEIIYFEEKLLDLLQTASTDNTDADFWQESGLLILS